MSCRIWWWRRRSIRIFFDKTPANKINEKIYDVKLRIFVSATAAMDVNDGFFFYMTTVLLLIQAIIQSSQLCVCQCVCLCVAVGRISLGFIWN